MTIPKGAKAAWTEMMNNPPERPSSIGEGEYIAASYAQFSDGVSVFGGVAAGPSDRSYNYVYFIVFDKDRKRVPDWPIDTSDWENFYINSVDFSIDDDDDDDRGDGVYGDYRLTVVEAS